MDLRRGFRWGGRGLHELQVVRGGDTELGRLQRDGDDGDAESDAVADERGRWSSGVGDGDVFGDG